MLRITANTKNRARKLQMHRASETISGTTFPGFLPQKAKMLAWGIFLFYFIENGTLGLIPANFYFIYRNIRISDFLLYGMVIHSFFRTSEYAELFNSKTTIILKLMLVYLMVQFIVSCILYDYNVIEYFFRLKGIWTSFLVFPFLLLMKRNGLPYLVKLVLPVAIVANILYILSALTGTAFMPGLAIENQDLPGGLQVYRVFGGTFFGELFFLGYIYIWITDKFRTYQLALVVLFALPHILAFGRSAWLYFIITIVVMFIWFSLRKRKAKVTIRQIVIVSILLISVFYGFMKVVPRSEYFAEAIQARVEQGQDDFTHKEGTYGTRLVSIDMLIQLWLNNNVVFGIGMHPLWVVKPVTEEENLYAWGFSDVGWASVLAAYGAIGFLFATVFQVSFVIITFRIIKNTIRYDLITFLVLTFFTRLLFDSVLNYSFNFFTSGLWGFPLIVVYIAAVVYKHEHLNDSF